MDQPKRLRILDPRASDEKNLRMRVQVVHAGYHNSCAVIDEPATAQVDRVAQENENERARRARVQRDKEQGRKEKSESAKEKV
jgi:hypothetical protein